MHYSTSLRLVDSTTPTAMPSSPTAHEMSWTDSPWLAYSEWKCNFIPTDPRAFFPLWVIVSLHALCKTELRNHITCSVATSPLSVSTSFTATVKLARMDNGTPPVATADFLSLPRPVKSSSSFQCGIKYRQPRDFELLFHNVLAKRKVQVCAVHMNMNSFILSFFVSCYGSHLT